MYFVIAIGYRYDKSTSPPSSGTGKTKIHGRRREFDFASKTVLFILYAKLCTTLKDKRCVTTMFKVLPAACWISVISFCPAVWVTMGLVNTIRIATFDRVQGAEIFNVGNDSWIGIQALWIHMVNVTTSKRT